VSHDIVLKNGLVVTPNGVIRGGIAIEGEQIVAVGASSGLGQAKREIDVAGKILFPGTFDPHVHFGIADRFGDEAMVEDFLRDTKDCLIGGVTTIATTTLIGKEPMLDLFDQAVECGTNHSWCDFKVTCVVNTLDQVAQIPAVAAKGGVSYKFFTGYAGPQAEAFGMNPDGITPSFFHAACEQLARCGPPTFAKIHAEDPHVRGILIDRLREMGRADQLRVPIYPVHISAAHTVETVKRLHAEGLNIVGETVACFLNTTAPEMDAQGMGGKAKIQPPIRFEKDKERLWRGLREGTLSVVGTDSLTYSSSFKTDGDFWDCRVGINLQVADTLPLLFHEGVNKGRIDLVTLSKILSENAAKLYGLYPKKGALAIGSDADIVVLDPEKEAVLGVDRMRSRADYSLWEGRQVKGIPVKTFLRGQLVMEDGEIVAEQPSGRFVEQVVRPRGL
jgi:dihydropyrimidinase/dihydroorotase